MSGRSSASPPVKVMFTIPSSSVWRITDFHSSVVSSSSRRSRYFAAEQCTQSHWQAVVTCRVAVAGSGRPVHSWWRWLAMTFMAGPEGTAGWKRLKTSCPSRRAMGRPLLRTPRSTAAASCFPRPPASRPVGPRPELAGLVQACLEAEEIHWPGEKAGGGQQGSHLQRPSCLLAEDTSTGPRQLPPGERQQSEMVACHGCSWRGCPAPAGGVVTIASARFSVKRPRGCLHAERQIYMTGSPRQARRRFLCFLAERLPGQMCRNTPPGGVPLHKP